MIVKATVNIGGQQVQFEADEKDEMEAMHKVIALSNPHTTCNICNDQGLANKKFTTNKHTGEKGTFTFVNIKCKCGARSSLGEYKTGGYFWKAYEKYEKQSAPATPAGATTTEDESLGNIG